MREPTLALVLSWAGFFMANRAGLLVWGFERGGLRWSWTQTVIQGLFVGVFIALADALVFSRFMPDPHRPPGTPSVLARLGALVYGAVNEEVMLRLFAATAVLFLLGMLNTVSSPPRSHLIAAVVVSSFLFALLHLPAAASVWPLTTTVMVRTIVLNVAAGLVLGFLYVIRGLEYSMMAHLGLGFGLVLVERTMSVLGD